MQFVNSLSITGNPNNPTVTHGSAYEVSSASFSIDVAEAHQINTAVVFVSATHNGSFVGLTFTVDGSPVSATAVSRRISGRVRSDGVPFDGCSPALLSISQRRQLLTSSTAPAASGSSIRRWQPIESTITTTTIVTETFSVSEDERPGGPRRRSNAANDKSAVGCSDVSRKQLRSATRNRRPACSLRLAVCGSVGADEAGSYSSPSRTAGQSIARR